MLCTRGYRPTVTGVDSESTADIATELLRWYRVHGKMYSFRKTTDPYRVLVSEILLRQTQAVQVDSVFDAFVTDYPTITHLASADPERLRELLRPLGMINRAEQLVTMARTVVSEHSGEIPRDLDALLALPGVGEYVAGCTLSLAFGVPTPAVDVNIERVISRLYSLPQRGGGKPASRVREAYLRLVSRAGNRSLHYAMIDLAHQVCKYPTPHCEVCPLGIGCEFVRSSI